MPVRYPIQSVEVGSDSGSENISIPFTRPRELYADFEEYTLEAKDTFQNPAHTYSSIADTVYGNEELWYILADSNPLIHECNLETGITIKIPNITRRLTEDTTVISSSIT